MVFHNRMVKDRRREMVAYCVQVPDTFVRVHNSLIKKENNNMKGILLNNICQIFEIILIDFGHQSSSKNS